MDALPSSQRGFRHLLPHSSLCFEGKGVVIPFAILKTMPSSLISIAIWGRDVRIVILTGSFWLANLAGAFYGNCFLSSCRSVVEVLIPLFIALTRVGLLILTLFKR